MKLLIPNHNLQIQLHELDLPLLVFKVLHSI